MKKKAVCLLIFLFLFAAPGFAKDFSADVENRVKGGQPMTGKVFLSGEKVRTEMAGMVSITRLDKKVVWILMPEQKMYMEQPLKPEDLAKAGEKSAAEIGRKYLGEERVDGRAAKKYKVTYKTDKEENSMYQWIDNELQVPVKLESVDGDWTLLYKNVKVGAQRAELFEVPSGYQKVSVGMPPIKMPKFK